MSKIVEEKIIDGVLHYCNENGDYRQYSLESLAVALTAERRINKDLNDKVRTLSLITDAILYNAKILKDALS